MDNAANVMNGVEKLLLGPLTRFQKRALGYKLDSFGPVHETDNEHNDGLSENSDRDLQHSTTDSTDSTYPQSEFSLIDVPLECGIMLELINEDTSKRGNGKDGQVILHTGVRDKGCPNIHPHCHVPSYVDHVHLLYGGGSGTAVFHGKCEKLGSIVMKHGGYKDVQEIFSLITVRQELSRRAVLQQQILKNEAIAAAERMRQKIPEFIMVYISPFHLRDRNQELWASLRSSNIKRTVSGSDLHSIQSQPHSSWRKSKFGRHSVLTPQPRKATPIVFPSDRTPRKSTFSQRLSTSGKNDLMKKEQLLKRRLRVCTGSDNSDDSKHRWHSDANTVDIELQSPVSAGVRDFIVTGGMDALRKFGKHLGMEMLEHQWKVTLAQKTIGGENAENGAHVLTSGKFKRPIDQTNQQKGNNPLLLKLVTEFRQVMEDLSTLTYNQERGGSRMKKILLDVQKIKDIVLSRETNNVFTEEWDDPFLLVTKEMDEFVGSAIKKNFDPVDGRFVKLRDFSSEMVSNISLMSKSTSTECLHDSYLSVEEMNAISATCGALSGSALSSLTDRSSVGGMVLTKDEEIPARLLAKLIDPDGPDADVKYLPKLVACVSDDDDDDNDEEEEDNKHQRGIVHVFAEPPSVRCALDEMEDRGWLDLLEHATSFAYDETIDSESRSAALDCIWTCGLTDAGLHNAFVHQVRGLEMFDLGEPRLEPQPAFLTKFLMSFFHTLGMEDDCEAEAMGKKGRWVKRFTVIVREDGAEVLELTEKTKEMIEYIHDVFNYTLDYFVEYIFYKNENVRTLLLKYVILQLLSDSAFCICRWEEKGGGTERYGEKLNEPLEKWLWRSIWDQYCASYVYSKLLLPCETKAAAAAATATTTTSARD